MTDVRFTSDQLRAITTLEGNVFVAAGAGSGKTGVVTHRFVYAVATGTATVDEILTITFTRKAAAEMMGRIRQFLRERDTIIPNPTEAQLSLMADAYRNIERAQISTIDSFYTGVLRAHALAAGIDPNFSAVDESQARLIQEEVFDACLRKLVEEEGTEAVEFITAYDPDLSGRLFETVTETYDALRSQGKTATLPFPKKKDVKLAENALRQATAAARAAFTRLAEPTKSQLQAAEKLEVIESALTAADPVERVRLADSVEIRAGNCGAIREEMNGVEEARQPYVIAERSCLAEKTLGLFRKLLEHFDERYAFEKHNRGMLDFSDLSILTRNLLRDNKSIRNRVSSRFKLIMVDEFQDTNFLQDEIIRMIANDNLFAVGDENQAIYGFRNAEVALFQQEKERARDGGYLIELTENFRSQPQILDFIDFIYDREGMLAPRYLKLKASATDEPEEDFRVEIIFVDERRKSVKEGLQKVEGATTRKAEAQLIAERLSDLFKNGYSPGDVAILMKTRTDAEIYRNALTRAGIENYFAVGSSYFGKLELIDVLNMFKIIINPYDELALISALRSPMAGLSDDALYWLRNSGDPAVRQHQVSLWDSLKMSEVIARLNPKDSEKLAGFVAGFQELRRQAGRETLRNLARRVVNFGDYAATITAGQDGKQNLANLLKLLDLAADFEMSWGNDLVEFTDFLEHQKQIEAREVEAPTEEEDVEAVRIMTMHGAKGLEFPLVVLPKLQAPGKSDSRVLMIDRGGDDLIGLRYITNSGADGKAFEYDQLMDDAHERDRQELKRLGYVAMTRAEKHLILTGVAPADKPSNPNKKNQLPFDWLRSYLSMCWERDENLGSVDCIKKIDSNKVGLQICTDPELFEQRYVKAGEQRDREAPAGVNPDITRMPEPAIFVPPSVSPTALDTYCSCPRRYYLDHVLRVGDMFETGGTGKKTAKDGVLSLTEMGLLIHKVLEKDLPGLESRMPSTEMLNLSADEAIEKKKELSPADHSRAMELIDNFKRCAIAADLFSAAASGQLQRELSFSTLIGQTILQGQIDALCPMPAIHGAATGETATGETATGETAASGDNNAASGSSGATEMAGTLVVDYKTGQPGEGRTPEEAAQTYRLQMASYALAASRLRPGPVRVVLAYLGGDDPVEVRQEFSVADIPALENEIQSVIDSMADGDFPPIAEFDLHQCPWCTGGLNGARLCIHADQAASV